MAFMQLAQQTPDFGFSIKKLVKKGAKIAVAPAYYSSKFALNVALKPVRSRINSVVAGRARKLAWTRRKSRQPIKAEVTEARAWTKQQFRKKGPHGALLATLAGVDSESTLLGDIGVAPALVAAVPALTALAIQITKSLQSKGDILPPGFQPAVEAAVAPTPEEAEQKAQQSMDEMTAAAEQQALEGGLLGDDLGLLLPPQPASRVGLGIGLGLGLVAAGVGILFTR